MQNKKIVGTKLPLPPIINSPPSDIPQNHKSNRTINYYHALKHLKQINQKIDAIKKRINLLSYKQQRVNNPVSDYYEKRQQRLRKIAFEDNKKSQQKLKILRDKTLSEITLKRKSNELRNRQSSQKINKAKRVITQQKLKNRQRIRQCSLQNKKKIQEFKVSFLVEKQANHDKITEYIRKKQRRMKLRQQSRISEIREECKQETNEIINEIRLKEKELKEVQAKCQEYQLQFNAVVRNRNKKMKRIQHFRKPITLQTRPSLFNSCDLESSTGLSFVIIS